MATINKNKNIVVTVPEELKESSKQLKFLYLALRNVIYAQRSNTYNNIDLHQFAINLFNTLDYVNEQNNLNIFKDQIEHDGLFTLICSYDRNIMNRNEAIIVMHKILKPANNLKREQLLTIFTQFMLECALQVSNDILTYETASEVYDELMKKLMVKTGKNVKDHFISEVLDTFNII